MCDGRLHYLVEACAAKRTGPLNTQMHDQMPLPLAMLIIFGSAKLLAELFERIGQPGIVGEILAGALVGPSVLGWIAPNDTLKALSDLGVLFLLFGVGMEVKASELLKVGGKATLVATLGVIFPFFAGWGILFAWGAPQLEAIFVGASMVATSVGITASVLSARGVLHEVASKVILAAAVIDDVLGLIVLAGVALSDSSDARMRTLTRGVSELLVPFFLAGIGLHLNFGVFRSRSTIALALVILAAAVVTKLVGCGLGAI